tara:strand:- start:278 stop:448 length:171 start_codon:yes stop_codon:yes gene_type:complete
MGVGHFDQLTSERFFCIPEAVPVFLSKSDDEMVRDNWVTMRVAGAFFVEKASDLVP